jgi:hypothetical protein
MVRWGVARVVVAVVVVVAAAAAAVAVPVCSDCVP